ncbi:MAG: hypothetical protein AAF823_00010 [Planctomycetota bacterium]
MSWVGKFIEKRLYPREYYFGFHRGLSAADVNKFSMQMPIREAITRRVVVFVALSVLCWIPMSIWEPETLIGRVIEGALSFALLLTFLWLLASEMPRQYRRHLGRVADEIGLRPIRCLNCAYDLRMIRSETCPECGARIPGVLRVDDSDDSGEAWG